MKISDDKLKLFDLEGDLRKYLKVNGLKESAVDQSVDRWKNLNTEDSTKEKTTMVVTETDTAVETK
jgi:hypothetical protein